MQFVMAGGGTGGHVIPALAVAGELKRRGHEPVFFGTRNGYEAKLVPAVGFPIEFIDIGGLNRVGLLQTIRTIWMLPASILRCWMWMGKHRPGAVFSMGGYVAGPVVIAALLRGIPLVAMEPNAVPGLTNRKAARWTAAALINFEETARYFPEGRAVLTGVPVREQFFDRARWPREFGRPFTVLITGGSQGSRTLNYASRDSWAFFERAGLSVRIVHQVGRSKITGLSNPPRFVQLSEFIQEMPAAFGDADLVISRAGASTVSELIAAGKPAILVPFPFAADDHQRRNAEAMVRAGAARLVDDKEMNGKRLFDEVSRLMQAPDELAAMKEAALRLAKPGAAARAADVLEKVASKSH
jgi:UDP-N-acetylglucosamine--N-acetylmuramyl-(pentapeptide) pyrophosphoryl-undecaprenol N-acetylglucosamine transferase